MKLVTSRWPADRHRTFNRDRSGSDLSRSTLGQATHPCESHHMSPRAKPRQNSTHGSPSHRSPAELHLVARAERSAPSQTKFPAEGPSLQTSLALNLDPDTVQPSPTSLHPASRTGTNPLLFQSQSPLSCRSHRPPIRHSRHTVTMPVLDPGSVPITCPSSSPTDTRLAPQLNSEGPASNPAQNTPPPQLNPVCISYRRADLQSVCVTGEV